MRGAIKYQVESKKLDLDDYDDLILFFLQNKFKRRRTQRSRPHNTARLFLYCLHSYCILSSNRYQLSDLHIHKYLYLYVLHYTIVCLILAVGNEIVSIRSDLYILVKMKLHRIIKFFRVDILIFDFLFVCFCFNFILCR